MPTPDEQIEKAKAAIRHMQMLIDTGKADSRDFPTLRFKIAGATDLIANLRAHGENDDPDVRRQREIDAAWRLHRERTPL